MYAKVYLYFFYKFVIFAPISHKIAIYEII